MNPETVTVSKRGYIALPAYIRKEINIKPASRVLIHREKNQLILEAVSSFSTLSCDLGQVRSYLDNHSY